MRAPKAAIARGPARQVDRASDRDPKPTILLLALELHPQLDVPRRSRGPQLVDSRARDPPRDVSVEGLERTGGDSHSRGAGRPCCES